jgi:hypothetical protein
MKPGDMVMPLAKLLYVPFINEDMVGWDGESMVRRDEIMTFLGEGPTKWDMRYARVLHSTSARIGHVSLEHITVVSR